MTKGWPEGLAKMKRKYKCSQKEQNSISSTMQQSLQVAKKHGLLPSIPEHEFTLFPLSCVTLTKIFNQDTRKNRAHRQASTGDSQPPAVPQRLTHRRTPEAKESHQGWSPLPLGNSGSPFLHFPNLM